MRKDLYANLNADLTAMAAALPKNSKRYPASATAEEILGERDGDNTYRREMNTIERGTFEHADHANEQERDWLAVARHIVAPFEGEGS